MQTNSIFFLNICILIFIQTNESLFFIFINWKDHSRLNLMLHKLANVMYKCLYYTKTLENASDSILSLPIPT